MTICDVITVIKRFSLSGRLYRTNIVVSPLFICISTPRGRMYDTDYNVKIQH